MVNPPSATKQNFHFENLIQTRTGTTGFANAKGCRSKPENAVDDVSRRTRPDRQGAGSDTGEELPASRGTGRERLDRGEGESASSSASDNSRIWTITHSFLFQL
jgi:hypothetical protein